MDHIQQIEWSAIEDGVPTKIVIYLGESKVIIVLTLEFENQNLVINQDSMLCK